MSDEQQVAESFQRFKDIFPGLFTMAEVVGKIGNLNEAVAARENAYTALQAKHASLEYEMNAAAEKGEARLVEIAVQSQKAKAEMSELVDRRKVEGNEIIASARAEAAAIIEAAKESAGKIFSQANAVAASAVVEAKARADEAAGGLESLAHQIAERKTQLSGLDDRLAGAAAREAAIEAHIARLKGM